MNKFTLLIVDDSPVSRMWIKKKIPLAIKEDIEIKEAGNGLIALNLYKESSFNLVFMDITMPVMDGIEATQEIIKYDPNAKIIVISSNRQDNTRDKLLKTGAIDMLHKPIEEERFQTLLQDIFSGYLND